MNLQVENTKGQWMMTLARFKDVMYNTKVCFFTKTGILLDENNLWLDNEDCVILATVKHNSKSTEQHESFTSDEIILDKKILYN